MKCSGFKQVIVRAYITVRDLDLQKGSLPFRKQGISESILLWPPCSVLHKGHQYSNRDRQAEHMLKSILTWGYKTLWGKSYARTILPTESCLVCQEACRFAWPSWGKLFLLTHRVNFTQWSLNHHFRKAAWGPADYGEKLENSKSKASESQPKKGQYLLVWWHLWCLCWLESVGDRQYSSSRQEAEPKPPTTGVWAAQLHSRDGGWWSVHNTSLQSSSCLWLCGQQSKLWLITF